MIVSASYRTDVPALYGRWFMRRLDAGFARWANPYGGRPYRVSLAREDMDGFVFWSKNPAPFLPALGELHGRGYPFVLQFTLTGYPGAIEAAVPAPERAVALMHGLARRYGSRAVVWRYDPILFTDVSRPDWHLDNFRRLAAALAGAADEVVVSFAHVYRKTRANLIAAARRHGFAWCDPEPDEKRQFLARLAEAGAEHGFTMTLCSQPEYLAPGLRPARCIDALRLSDVAGRAIRAPTKGNRPGCLCAAARDIGAYDSCTMACVYCYAVRSPALAKARRRAHDPSGEFLVPL